MSLKYLVIERYKDKYSISEMCKLFEVSRSSYYAWRKRQEHIDRDKEIADKIIEIWNQSHQTYGCRRIWKYLRVKLNIQINIKKVRRIMQKYGIASVIRRPKIYTHNKDAVHKYQNLLDRKFRQETPNTFWVTDITYIPTEQGFVYMCAVMDLHGRMVLSWRIGNDMTTTLVTDTIRDALAKEKVTNGLALHSDQGSQYTSKEYFDLTNACNQTSGKFSVRKIFVSGMDRIRFQLRYIPTHYTIFSRRCPDLDAHMTTQQWKIFLERSNPSVCIGCILQIKLK